MRDVSKNRAHKIHKAQNKRDKDHKKEIKHKAKEEKRLNKIKEHKEHNKGAHTKGDSQLELEKYRRGSAASAAQYAQSASHGVSAYNPLKDSIEDRIWNVNKEKQMGENR